VVFDTEIHRRLKAPESTGDAFVPNTDAVGSTGRSGYVGRRGLMSDTSSLSCFDVRADEGLLAVGGLGMKGSGPSCQKGCLHVVHCRARSPCQGTWMPKTSRRFRWGRAQVWSGPSSFPEGVGAPNALIWEQQSPHPVPQKASSGTSIRSSEPCSTMRAAWASPGSTSWQNQRALASLPM
jgi:hypothetical protein